MSDNRQPGEIEIDAAKRASAASRNALGHIEDHLKTEGRNDLYLHTLGRVQLLTETLMHGREDKARDRLILAMAEGLQVCLRHTYALTGHDIERFEPMVRELRDAKILFAATLDRS